MTTHHHRGGFHPANDPARRQWQEPEAVLESIGLKAGMTIADLGCGAGFFALPAARIVGAKGKVYGVDANPEAIASLKDEAAREGLKNLVVSSGTGEDYLPCEKCADIIFMGIVLHDFDDPVKVLQNARRIVKPTGKLIDLDWKKEGVPFGPPPEIKFDEAKASKLIMDAGFKIVSTESNGNYHYMITAVPA